MHALQVTTYERNAPINMCRSKTQQVEHSRTTSDCLVVTSRVAMLALTTTLPIQVPLQKLPFLYIFNFLIRSQSGSRSCPTCCDGSLVIHIDFSMVTILPLQLCYYITSHCKYNHVLTMQSCQVTPFQPQELPVPLQKLTVVYDRLRPDWKCDILAHLEGWALSDLSPLRSEAFLPEPPTDITTDRYIITSTTLPKRFTYGTMQQLKGLNPNSQLDREDNSNTAIRKTLHYNCFC